MSRNRFGEWVGHLGAGEALQRGKAVSTWAAAEGQGCSSPGLHAAAQGDFYGAIVVISKHKFFHIPNIVEGSNSVIAVSAGQECPGNLLHPEWGEPIKVSSSC